MVDPLTHPAADRDTPEALVVEQDRSVVPLSSWLGDAAVTAARTGRVLQVLTPPRSRITYPLELLISEGGAQWIVRDGPESFRDGFTGVPMRWTGARFTTDDASAPTPLPATAGGVEVQITTVHRPDSSLRLGATTEAAMHALVGAPPAGWGSSEPATEPWSPREITRYCHERSPSPTNLVVVGSGDEVGPQDAPVAVGTLEVRRVDTGVLERVRLAGPADSRVSQAGIEDLAAAVAGHARSMLVASHPARRDGLRWHTPTPPAVPYGLLVGPDVVSRFGRAHAESAPAPRARVLGVEDHQSCWCRLDAGSKAPYEHLVDVLHHFGLTEER